jgi:hypothetical protein
MKVAVVQSNFFPWRGYFSLIASVDLFVFHDDLQYTKNDWRNRNQFLCKDEIKWLTVPCGTSEKRKICDVKLPSNLWTLNHYAKLREWYGRGPFYKEHEDLLKEIFLENEFRYLSDFNQHWTTHIARKILKLDTKFIDSRILDLKRSKFERLKDLLSKVNATEYLTGPSAKNYLNELELNQMGITLQYADYTKLPNSSGKYNSLSILHDLLTYPEITQRVAKV